MSETRLPTIDDFADAEHCVLEDVTAQHPAISPDSLARPPGKLRESVSIRDKLRGRSTLVRFFDNGWIDLAVIRRRNDRSKYRIDLRYLDPVPFMQRYYPMRLIKAAGLVAALTVLLAIPAMAGWYSTYLAPAALISGAVTLSLLFMAFFRTHEKISFRTLHGRADTIRFTAGLGTIHRFHRLLPKLVDAIADAVESIQEETIVYLRAEMREHYRLKREGVLSADICAESTGRILGNFDGPI